MKKLSPFDFKDELIKVTCLSEKHIDNFMIHLSSCMNKNNIELSDLTILFLNEKNNGNAANFALNFIGYFYLSTFTLFMSLLEGYVF